MPSNELLEGFLSRDPCNPTQGRARNAAIMSPATRGTICAIQEREDKRCNVYGGRGLGTYVPSCEHVMLNNLQYRLSPRDSSCSNMLYRGPTCKPQCELETPTLYGQSGVYPYQCETSLELFTRRADQGSSS